MVASLLPAGARPALDYVARSDAPSCCVSGSDVLRPFDTFGWGDSVPPRTLDAFLPSDWEASLSASLSVCETQRWDT